MPRFSRYDPAADVIETDASGLQGATHGVIDAVFDELEAVARAWPGRYVLACWKNSSFASAEVAAYYGERTTRLLRLIKGIVRYAADDPATRTHVRSEAMKHRAEGMRSNLFETRDEALAALVRMRAADKAGAR